MNRPNPLSTHAAQPRTNMQDWLTDSDNHGDTSIRTGRTFDRHVEPDFTMSGAKELIDRAFGNQIEAARGAVRLERHVQQLTAELQKQRTRAFELNGQVAELTNARDCQRRRADALDARVTEPMTERPTATTVMARARIEALTKERDFEREKVAALTAQVQVLGDKLYAITNILQKG